MKTLSNKHFSDWYDNQYGEPSYQQTWEAGYAQALVDKSDCTAIKVSNDTYENYLKKTEAQGCPECGSDYIEHVHSEYCGQEIWYWLCRKCDHQWDHG